MTTAVGEVKAMRVPSDGAYLDRLSHEQRMSLLREQKTERAAGLTEQARDDYDQEVERFHRELEKRVAYLKECLFKVEDAGALARAALATDTELGTLMELATQAGNAELGKAAYVACEQRGLTELLQAYYDNIDPEAQELYAEYREVPPEHILERQAESVSALLPDVDADSLMAPQTLWR